MMAFIKEKTEAESFPGEGEYFNGNVTKSIPVFFPYYF